MKCDHLDCGNLEKIWLPYILREQHIGLKSHPFCIHCGMVKNIGSDRAKSIGYFINVISLIDKKLKLPGSSVRMRLIAKDLEMLEDFDDAYSMSRYGQEKIIIGLLKKYYKIPERTIQEFL